MYNTYVAVAPEGGNVYQHRKVHAFENSAVSQGDRLEVFELFGWTMGVLICYDNNLPENPRILCLKGAEVIFAPHQTGGFDVDSAGMGRIGLDVWRNRGTDPTALRQEFDGPKGRQWIMKWLPSRAYDNNLYYVYTNGVGIDDDEVRTGGCMIIDPEGIVIEETTALGDDMIVASLDKSAREHTVASGNVASRRPSLYGKLVEAADEVSTREIRNKLTSHTIK
jgi:predicted amidohydrolase